MRAAVLLVGALLLAPAPAEAARCAYGKVYRPSIGVCQSKVAAARAGVYRPRYAKASIRHRYKRERPAKQAKPVMRAEASAYPPPAPPWRTPMFDVMEIERIASSPFGALAPMPESPAAWAARNAQTFKEN